MDQQRFDELVKSLSSTDTRRALLRRLAPLPLAGLLATLLHDESAAGGRRKRRKTRNTRQSGDDKENRTGKRKGKRKDKNRGTNTTPTSCTKRTCPANACGSQPDGCGGTLSCGGCGPDQLCTGGTCVAKVCGNGGPCVVFVSRTRFVGVDIGGLGGADAKCQGDAGVADSLAPPGTYRAWLSDDTGSPATRFVHSSGPYVLVHGKVVAANWADLTDGQLLAAIDQNQVGEEVLSEVWSNTSPAGLPTTPGDERSCSRWGPGGAFGHHGATTRDDVGWTETSGTMFCTDARPLYCFQQS